MEPVPFVDLQPTQRELRAEIERAIAGVLADTSFILGEELTRFESEFAAYCGTDFAIGVGSGLDALALALEARGIGPGDEVVTVANTFIATVCAIHRTGAAPVLVDCLEETANIDPDQVERAITPRTRALVAVHLYGALADMDALREIADRHGLFLLEDAAQAHGALREGTRAGAFGDAGAFSFYPSKNLGAAGDGGCVVTNDADLARKVRLLRNYGQEPKNRHAVVGHNSRLDTLQAAILRVKLPHLDRWNEARRGASERYRALLAGSAVGHFRSAGREAHVHHLEVVRIAERDRIAAELAERGVQTGVHYPVPIHLQPAFGHLGHRLGAFPVTERLAAEILSLPLFPGIEPEQIGRAAGALGEALR